jgi:transcriptional regulator with XRE-family HTH domain
VPAQGESPAVARRRVRLALKKAREALGLSQSTVAKKMEWSLSKVQRIESGDVGISGTDLRVLLDLYGVTDEEEVEQLLEEARISRRQRWWTAAEYRDHLSPGLRQLLQFEAEAVAVRVYQPVLVPGAMQTPAQADFVLGWWNKSLTDDERRVRYNVRMQRRREIIDAPDGPLFLLILDESALKREVGGLEVMAEQLETLAEIASRPNIKIRIVPLQEGALLGVLGSFVVLDLDEKDPTDAVLYREIVTRDEIIHDPAEVRFYRENFERLWLRSYDEEKSLRAIDAEARNLRVRLDRGEA